MFVQQMSVENKSIGYTDSSWKTNSKISIELERNVAEFIHVTPDKSGRGVSSKLAVRKICDFPVADSW